MSADDRLDGTRAIGCTLRWLVYLARDPPRGSVGQRMGLQRMGLMIEMVSWRLYHWMAQLPRLWIVGYLDGNARALGGGAVEFDLGFHGGCGMPDDRQAQPCSPIRA